MNKIEIIMGSLIGILFFLMIFYVIPQLNNEKVITNIKQECDNCNYMEKRNCSDRYMIDRIYLIPFSYTHVYVGGLVDCEEYVENRNIMGYNGDYFDILYNNKSETVICIIRQLKDGCSHLSNKEKKE
jgi:hypothetical protein